VSGQKYYFRAGSDMERENWIEQLQDASRITVTTTYRVATHMENLEKSGNLRVVRENRKSHGKCVLACMKFAQLVLRKIIEIVATRCQIFRLKCTKFDFSLQCSPRPASWI